VAVQTRACVPARQIELIDAVVQDETLPDSAGGMRGCTADS